MNRILFSLVLLSAAASLPSAFASKARVASLQGANHLIDSQTVFTAPSHLLSLSPYLTFEMGTAGGNAEGGILKDLGGGQKLLVYLGHQNPTNAADTAIGDLRGDKGYIVQRNPIEVLYGTGSMAFGGSLSMVDNKAANTKETTVVGKFGMNFDPESWLYAHVHIVNQAEKGATTGEDEMKVGPFIKLGASKGLNNYRFFGELNFGNGEEELGAGGDRDAKDLFISAGFEDRSLRTQIADIYYGIKAVHAKRDYNDLEQSELRFPAFLGIEYGLNDWSIVRASVQQNILFGREKNETATVTDADGVDADNRVAAGLGFKYKNFVLDGSLAAATSGNINGNSVLTQASLTYNF